MERKTIETMNVLQCTLQSSLKTLMADTGNIPLELMQKADELQLDIVGPQIWQYSGSDGNPETLFTLDICIPVAEFKGEPGKFQFTQLDSFPCVTDIHKGAWHLLGNTYQLILGEMARKTMIPTCISREVYLFCDFENQENCITEVQIQLQS